MAITAIPGIGMIAGSMVLADEEYDRLRLEYRDLDPRKARVMADISGIAQMGIEKLQLKALGGRLPMLGKLFNEMKPGLWKTAGVIVGANLEQNVQENLQNLVPVAVDALGAAIGHDMPGHDLRRDLGEWVHQMPQTFFAVLPMALVGGGVAHFRDFSDDGRFLLEPEMLAIAGFSRDQQQYIHTAHTMEEAQARYREEFSRRSPENIAAGLELLQKAREQAEQQQADPAQPRLEAITRGERGTEWIVRDSAGRETLRTQNSETAQLALAELQQSAARQKQASTLRFSKSGDQAENVGRMWVDLAGDERTAVLGSTPTAKDMASIVSTLSDGKEPFNIVEDQADDGSMIELRLDEKGQRYAHVSANAYNPGEIYVQSQYAGENSTLAYQAIYAWAHNNGLKVIEDPATLSEVAILRRTSQMLSSALRFGTTRHMEPGPVGGITGWREEKTQADFLHNVGVLAMREAELVVERLKEVKGLRYDGETHAFYDGEHRIPAEEVSTYFGRRIAEVDSNFSRRIGNATLRRALATVAAEGARTHRGWRLVGEDAKAGPGFDRIRYVRKDRGEQEVPGSGSTEARGEPAEVSGGTRRPRENGGVSREQARQWVGEVLRKWGSHLDVTVHESAEAIPDGALRDRVLGEGSVEGFYLGTDGRVHVLADQIPSRERVEPLLKHEGFHWVVDGPLKAEYESLREWARKQIPADKLEQLRRNYPEEVTVEEYLAHLAETNPESTVWKQFIYEFRRLLRKILGDRVEFTEEDLRAFLAKAQKRVERAKSSLSSTQAVKTGRRDFRGNDEIRFSVEKSTMPHQVKNLGEAIALARNLVGKEISNADTRMSASISGNSLRKMTSESAVRKSEDIGAHVLAVANVDRLFENAALIESHADRGSDRNIEAIHRFYAPMISKGEILAVKITVKELRHPAQNRIYSVEAIDVEKVKPAGLLAHDLNNAQTSNAPLAGFMRKLHELALKIKYSK